MDHATLGRQVKQLHPGAYDAHPDEVIGQAMMRKFPGIYDENPDEGTITEAPKTLQIQLGQLKAGKRKAVLLPAGTKVDPRAYKALPHKARPGLFLFNPRLLKRSELVEAIKNRRLDSILGDKDLGYGSAPKQKLKPPVKAVISRTKDGETVNGALADKEHEKTAVEAADRLKPDGGSVSVEPPAKEIAHRLTKNKKFRPSGGKRWPKMPEKR